MVPTRIDIDAHFILGNGKAWTHISVHFVVVSVLLLLLLLPAVTQTSSSWGLPRGRGDRWWHFLERPPGGGEQNRQPLPGFTRDVAWAGQAGDLFLQTQATENVISFPLSNLFITLKTCPTMLQSKKIQVHSIRFLLLLNCNTE